MDALFQLCLGQYLQEVKTHIAELKEGLANIQQLSSKLATHFCEEESKFKLEECLQTFKAFCEKIEQCQKVTLYSGSSQ